MNSAQSTVAPHRSPIVIAWLLPALYAVHLLEEYYAGVTLPIWLSETFRTDLSNTDFIWINSIAMLVILGNAILFSIGKRSMVILVAFVTVLAVNGVIHGLSSLFWWQYVPGTFSGLLLYIPLGVLAYRSLNPLITREEKRYGIRAGIVDPCYRDRDRTNGMSGQMDLDEHVKDSLNTLQLV